MGREGFWGCSWSTEISLIWKEMSKCLDIFNCLHSGCCCSGCYSVSWVMSDSLWPHGLQHTRLPCPSPSPGVCSNSCALSQWCHPTISSSATPFSSCPQFFSSIEVFSNKLALCIRWPKFWSFSFSISPLNEYSGLISFRTDRFDLLAVQGTLMSLLRHHNLKASILQQKPKGRKN